MDVPQNTVLNIGLPDDLAILLLDIYPTETKLVLQRAVSASMFIAALLTIAKNTKQLEYPPVAKEINNSVQTTTVHHTVECYSAIKLNECNNVGEPSNPF